MSYARTRINRAMHDLGIQAWASILGREYGAVRARDSVLWTARQRDETGRCPSYAELGAAMGMAHSSVIEAVRRHEGRRG